MKNLAPVIRVCNADVRMYLLPSFYAIFTLYHTLIFTNDETSEN